MQPDRRRFLRVEAGLRAQCSRVAADGTRGTPFPAETHNVSAGGAKLRATQPLQQGELLWVELEFDEPRLLLFCEAEVARVEGDAHTAGVRFLAMDQYVQQRIIRWVYAEDRKIFDRRAQVRIPVRLRIVCRRTGADPTGFAVPSLDVSGDGTRILTRHRLQHGEELEIDIHFDDGEPPVSCRALVVWIGQPGARTAYGLRFDGLSHAARRRLIQRCVAADEAQRQ